MVSKRRSRDVWSKAVRGALTSWVTVLFLGLLFNAHLAIACDVTTVDLWIGKDKAAAEGKNEDTVYKCAGDSFGWFVKWDAGTGKKPDFKGEIYLEGVLEKSFPKDGAEREESGTVDIPSEMTLGEKTVKAKVWRDREPIVSGEDEVTNLMIVSFEIDTPDEFPVYVAVNDTVDLGCTLEPSDVTGETYLWSKDSGPGTVTFTESTDEDPTFSADTAGEYEVKCICSIGGYDFDDTAGDIIVVASGSLVLKDLWTGNSEVDESNDDPQPEETLYVGTDIDGKGDVEF